MRHLLARTTPLIAVCSPAVTYRDDRDATLARADALEHDPAEVLATLRDHPDQVLELVEAKWGATIVTRTKTATCPTVGPTDLLVRLARYCPNAKARNARR